MSEFEKFNLSLADGKKFIDSKILDFISGETLQNRQRKLTSIVAEMVVGTTLKTDDLIQKLPMRGQAQGSIVVASKIMRLLILRGYKELPWNEKRREFVAKYFDARFFPEDGTFLNDPFFAQHEVEKMPPEKIDQGLTFNSFIPTFGPVMFSGEATLEETTEQEKTAELEQTMEQKDQQNSDKNVTQLQLRRWHRTNKTTFWTKVLNFARTNGIPIQGLATMLKEQHAKQRAWRKKGATGNHLRGLFTGLLEARGSAECFRYQLSIKMKTGNMEDVINAIRQRLASVGLERGSLVPSVRCVKRATSLIMKLFRAVCEPERTYSGFRVDLIKSVTFASLVLLGKTNLEGLKLDIWGDGCAIGGVEVTRLTFRILNIIVSSQSSNAVFCFASYRGKDSRYAMEQNFGPAILGNQESGWLYRQTKELQKLGVIITYSGDSPFLARLVLGISIEHCNEHPSQIPVYVCEENFLPTCCSAIDGRRTSLKVPFRQNVPREALSSIVDVRTVCPDAVHMITRCTENDIRKVAQKVINDKHPWDALSLQRFEENLTSREAKRPSFQFNVIHKNIGKTPGTVGPISLAGSNALTIIAETEELRDAHFGKISNLYEGVWTTELLLGSEDGYNLGAAKVLKSLHPHLFDKKDHKNPRNQEKYMSMHDACELLRHSLNQCAILLRSQGVFDVDTYKRWAETYFQINLLLFGQKGLSPYKLKIPLIAQLVESGYIEKPWNHLCEGMEKSNHNAHRNFQSRTMRGGGSVNNQDPLYLDTAFSFFRFLDISSNISGKKISNVIEHVRKTIATEEALAGAKTYLDICRVPLTLPRLAVGEKREFRDLLRGLRFLIAGCFTKFTIGPKKKLTQGILKDYILDMGGVVYDKEKAETLMRSHSNILNFYVVIKDEEDLVNATGDTQQIEAMRTKLKLHRHSSASELTTDAESKEFKRHPTKRKLSPAALTCKKFASGGFKFITVEYVLEMMESAVILDPENFIIPPGRLTTRMKVNDMRPLFRQQIDVNNSIANMSAISALKRYRNGEVKDKSSELYSDL